MDSKKKSTRKQKEVIETSIIEDTIKTKAIEYVELVGLGGPLKKGVNYKFPKKSADVLVSKGYAEIV
jgi:hypothetical protein